MKRLAPVILSGLLLAPLAMASIFEQSYIEPERAGQNKVRWRNYDWKYIDFLKEQDGKGGVRLYYYDREKAATELAGAAITDEYKHLKDTFGIVPDIQMPYILYASHLEFEEQNLFDISESILGVTSPEDLTLSLPYWGEHQRFVDVSRHEMAHQFTIQKVYQVQRLHQTRQNPLERLPLWFIEGLAEYSAHRGLHDEVPMFVADLLLNPDKKEKHELFPFWHDEVRNFVQTYRMGQVRVAYLAERFGEKVPQDVLGKSYLMMQRPNMQPTDQIYGFQGFVEQLTAMKPKALDEDFKAWLNKKFDIENLKKTPESPKVEEQKAVSDTMDSYSILPDGNLVIYRDGDLMTGAARLRLVDLRDPASTVSIAEEGKPGIESLHFFQRRVFDLKDGLIAFTALDRGQDVLYIQPFERRVEQKDKSVSVSFRLGERRKIDLRKMDILEAGDLSFSPDASKLAFVGLTPDGRGDIYWLEPGSKEPSPTPHQLTEDFYAERGLEWGERGLLFSSDRAGDGVYNLYIVHPETKELTRLTTSKLNLDGASYGSDGSILYSSFESGKSNVYRLRGTTAERLTDTHTGLFEPRETPDGLLVRKFYQGRFRLYKAAKSELKPLESAELAPVTVASLGMPPASVDAPGKGKFERYPLEGVQDAFQRLALDEPQSYKSTDLSNWKPEVAGAALSTSQVGGVYLAFSDRMKDQSFLIDLSVLGDFKYTDANLFYLNRKKQFGWGVGGLHTLNVRRDADRGELYLERDFGAYGVLYYPFDRFTHIQLGGGILGVNRSDYTGVNPEWEERVGGIKAQLDLSLSGGYDTVEYHYLTGPVQGTSLFGRLNYSFVPSEGVSVYGARADLQRYTRIWSGINLMGRLGMGVSFGDRQFREQYFISSFDNLRAFDFGDDRLLGFNYAVANLELQVPLGSFFKKPPALATILEGVVALDFGSVFDELKPAGRGFLSEMNDRRSADFVLGANFLLYPVMLRLHFAKPLDIGGDYSGGCASDLQVNCLPNNGNWLTNFSIRYAF